jgi:hypothetical protein
LCTEPCSNSAGTRCMRMDILLCHVGKVNAPLLPLGEAQFSPDVGPKNRLASIPSLASAKLAPHLSVHLQVFSNTYLANLAAFLTTDQLNQPADKFKALWGQVVGTYPIWESTLQAGWKLTTAPIPAVGDSASRLHAAV